MKRLFEPCDCPLCRSYREGRAAAKLWLSYRPLPWWRRFDWELFVAVCLAGAAACVYLMGWA